MTTLRRVNQDRSDTALLPPLIRDQSFTIIAIVVSLCLTVSAAYLATFFHFIMLFIPVPDLKANIVMINHATGIKTQHLPSKVITCDALSQLLYLYWQYAVYGDASFCR